MNDDRDEDGDNLLLAYVVGGILVAVLAFVAFGGFPGTKHQYASISVMAPAPTIH